MASSFWAVSQKWVNPLVCLSVCLFERFFPHSIPVLPFHVHSLSKVSNFSISLYSSSHPLSFPSKHSSTLLPLLCLAPSLCARARILSSGLSLCSMSRFLFLFVFVCLSLFVFFLSLVHSISLTLACWPCKHSSLIQLLKIKHFSPDPESK